MKLVFALFILLITLVNSQSISTDEILPSHLNYTFTTVLTPVKDKSSGSVGNFTFSWKLIDVGTNSESLQFLLTLSGFRNFSKGWAGIGFGKDMRTSEFVILKQSPAGVTSVKEHMYVPNNYGLKLTKSTDLNRMSLNTEGFQSMIWAYKPNSALNANGVHFNYHGDNGDPDDPFSKYHGSFTVNFSNGLVFLRLNSSFLAKEIHGAGMAICFLILIPVAVYFCRYYKSNPNWFIVHLVIQVTAITGMLCFFILIVLSYNHLSAAHSMLGLVIVSLVTFQAGFGSFTRLGMIRKDRTSYKFLKCLHWGTGTTIMLTSSVQVALGIDMLFPWSNTVLRGIEIWILYFSILSMWFLLFATTEIYYRVSVYGSKNFFNSKPMKEKKNLTTLDFLREEKLRKEKVPENKLDDLTKYQEKNAYKNNQNTKSYNWKEIDEEIISGKILVVANGKYVYDASKWISSHPGGKLILNSVAGTDISLDYFYEAGFDAQEFELKAPAPVRNANRPNLPVLTQTSAPKFNNITDFSKTTLNIQKSIKLTDSEWNNVVRSRRTHVHTRLALERLSSLLVGEIENIEYKGNNTVISSNSFCREEYRRYSIVEKTPLTREGSTVYWKIKFSLLYPYDVRERQPMKFKTGESVEIQVRLANGNILSRYYTPINGSPTSFEIILKEKKEGGGKQRPGDRQIKIRGPFGKSFVNTNPQFENFIPNNLVFICAGSGITPFLQLLSLMVIPIEEPLEVLSDYYPSAPDELEILQGQYVVAKKNYYDGWCWGLNLNSGREGIFPLSLATTRSGVFFKLTLINCVESVNDIVGREIIDAVMLSYPAQIEVHHLVSGKNNSSRNGVSGFIHNSEINGEILTKIIGKISALTSRRAIICGSPNFNSTVMDALFDEVYWEQHEIQSLFSDQF
ncbi:hypothetical protein HK099_008428 [Clydaea vesicula]|uniref:Uncharacterized protein n=1 Tax=Clydaea vesicula TaxID=447962 RepID=A0AAD5TVU7_9FUNG|nr:hypothetical protein HK099_008428 [Clydaea vesicula]